MVHHFMRIEQEQGIEISDGHEEPTREEECNQAPLIRILPFCLKALATDLFLFLY